MSQRLLIGSLRNLPQATVTIAANDFQKQNSVLVEVIKMLFSGEWASIGHYITNVHQGLTGIEELERALSYPNPSWINTQGQWDRVEFQFEGCNYYLCDLNLCKGKYGISDTDNSPSSLGLVQISTNIFGEEVATLVSTDFPGSLYSLVLKEKKTPNQTEFSTLATFDTRSLDESETALFECKFKNVLLKKLNETDLLQMEGFLLVKNGDHVHIEDSLTSKSYKTNVNLVNAFKTFITCVRKNIPVPANLFLDLRTELLKSAKPTLRDELLIMFGKINFSTTSQINKELILMYSIYSQFVRSINKFKDERNGQQRARWCADYLRKHPDHLHTIKKILPINDKSTLERYATSCQDSAQNAVLDGNNRKSELHSYLYSGLFTFIDALDIIEKQNRADDELILQQRAAFDYQLYPNWLS